MGKRIPGCILALARAGISMTATAAEPAPEASLFLPGATDADLPALKDKQDLRELNLADIQVTDAGLADLRASLADMNTHGQL